MAKEKQKDPMLKELSTIRKEVISVKKLLILSLYAADIPSEEINKAVKIGSGEIRRMFSKKKLKKANIKGGEK